MKQTNLSSLHMRSRASNQIGRRDNTSKHFSPRATLSKKAELVASPRILKVGMQHDDLFFKKYKTGVVQKSVVPEK